MPINRVLRFLRPSRPRAPANNWWIVVTEKATLRVSRRVARSVITEARRWRPRHWLELRDIHGSTMVVRARDVRLVAESTPEQRASYRAWEREREAEDSSEADGTGGLNYRITE